MRRVWVVVTALAWAALTTEARADTVYLTNGQNVWGREVYEEDDSVVIVRPGGDLRIPKSQVSRIQRVQSTLPPFYSPPSTEPTGTPERPGGAGGAPRPPGAPGGPAQATPPGPPTGELAPSPSPGGSSPATTPPEGATTQLPPPPPPPRPGGYTTSQ